MAIDVYLQIDGIKGESTDSVHRDWIECSSVSWAISQPKSATASTGGGHTAERCEHTDISFSKVADMSSPILMATCSSGKTIPKAKLVFLRADGKGERVKYFEIELENVLISHIAPSVMAGDILSENVGLKFSKVKWKYQQQKTMAAQAGTLPAAGIWPLTRMCNHIMRALLLLGLSLVATLNAIAQPAIAVPWMTGDRLLRMVTFPPGSKGNFDLTLEQYLDAQRARFYIEGVHDKSEGKSWCYSERYQPGPDALLDDIYAGLRKMPPAQLKRNASDLITEIWAKKWPCSGRTP